MRLTSFVDTLNRIKIAYISRKARIEVPIIQVTELLFSMLCRYGFLAGFHVNAEARTVTLFMRYHYTGQPAVTDIKLISTPGRRVLIKHYINSTGHSRSPDLKLSSPALVLIGKNMFFISNDTLHTVKSGTLLAFFIT